MLWRKCCHTVNLPLFDAIITQFKSRLKTVFCQHLKVKYFSRRKKKKKEHETGSRWGGGSGSDLKLTLCELLGFVVKRVHHFAHVLYRFQSSFVGLVHHRLFEDDQHAFSLVQNTWGHEDNSPESLTQPHTSQGTKRQNIPWNFLSKIICDNFLSTSPYGGTRAQHNYNATFKKNGSKTLVQSQTMIKRRQMLP